MRTSDEARKDNVVGQVPRRCGYEAVSAMSFGDVQRDGFGQVCVRREGMRASPARSSACFRARDMPCLILVPLACEARERQTSH